MGYWDNQGATPTKVTWSNPQFVAEGNRSNGGWYYNPGSGYVERWWSGQQQSSGGGGSSSGGGGGVDYAAIAREREAAAARARAEAEAKAEADRQAFIKAQEEARLKEQARLKAEEEQIFTSFDTTSKAQKPLTQAYGELEKTQGIPELTGQLNTLRSETAKVKDLIDRLEEDVSSRTEGKLVTEAQKRRMIAAEEAPLRTQLGRLAVGQQEAGEQVRAAYDTLGTKLSVLSADQAKELEPIRIRMAAFGDRAAREITAYSTAKQNELGLLLDKIQGGRQLAQDEWLKASELALNERQFQQQRQLIQEKSDQELKNTLALRADQAKTGTSAISNLSFDEFKKMFTGGGTTSTVTTPKTNDTKSTLDSIFGAYIG